MNYSSGKVCFYYSLGKCFIDLNLQVAINHCHDFLADFSRSIAADFSSLS